MAAQQEHRQSFDLSSMLDGAILQRPVSRVDPSSGTGLMEQFENKGGCHTPTCLLNATRFLRASRHSREDAKDVNHVPFTRHRWVCSYKDLLSATLEHRDVSVFSKTSRLASLWFVVLHSVYLAIQFITSQVIRGSRVTTYLCT